MESGSAIVRKTWNSVAPSSFALSMRSCGRFMKNWRTMIRLNELTRPGTISAGYELSMPSSLMSRNIGIMPGQISMAISTMIRTNRLPGTLGRERPQARVVVKNICARVPKIVSPALTWSARTTMSPLKSVR